MNMNRPYVETLDDLEGHDSRFGDEDGHDQEDRINCGHDQEDDNNFGYEDRFDHEDETGHQSEIENQFENNFMGHNPLGMEDSLKCCGKNRMNLETDEPEDSNSNAKDNEDPLNSCLAHLDPNSNTKIDEDPLNFCMAHFGLDFDVEESINDVNILLDSVPYFSPVLWKPESNPPPSSESLIQPTVKPWSSSKDHSCLIVAEPLKFEPPKHLKYKEDIHEHPWNKILWYNKKRIKRLFGDMTWAHHTSKILCKPQFEKLAYGTSPPNIIFYVEFQLLNYKRRRKWELFTPVWLKTLNLALMGGNPVVWSTSPLW
jgi:hypothetical protein